jgi:hypothetical protein
MKSPTTPTSVIDNGKVRLGAFSPTVAPGDQSKIRK